MANQVITSTIPVAPAGAITRSGAVVDAFMQSSTLPLTKYGLPFQIDASDTITGLVDTDRAADTYGFIVRPFPQVPGASSNEAILTATPPVYPAVVNGLRSGYCAVSVQYGTAAKGGKVYVRLAATSSTRYQGGIEAGAVAAVTNPTIVGTGTGTIACTVADATVIVPGTYVITLLSTSQTAACSVIDPNGNRLKDAVVGTEYTAAGLTFTITAAGTMTAGDKFSPVVSLTTEAIPGAFFTGAKDANNIAEIAYNI